MIKPINLSLQPTYQNSSNPIIWLIDRKFTKSKNKMVMLSTIISNPKKSSFYLCDYYKIEFYLKIHDKLTETLKGIWKRSDRSTRYRWDGRRDKASTTMLNKSNVELKKCHWKYGWVYLCCMIRRQWYSYGSIGVSTHNSPRKII